MKKQLMLMGLALTIAGCGSSSDEKACCGPEDISNRVDDAKLWEHVDVDSSEAQLGTFTNEQELQSYFDELGQKMADSMDDASDESAADGGGGSGAAEGGGEPAPSAPGAAENGDKSNDLAGEGSESPSEPDASSTTLQEIGVDEADLVKNDNQYMYISRQPQYEWVPFETKLSMPCVKPMPVEDVAVESKASIVEDEWCGPSGEYRPAAPASVRVMKMNEKPASTEELATIELPKNMDALTGLYLANSDGKGNSESLAVVGTDWQESVTQEGYYQNLSRVDVHLYNTATPSKPEEKWKFSLDGNLVATRRIDNMLYLVTSHDVYHYWYGVHDLPAVKSDVEPSPDALTPPAKPNGVVDVNSLVPTWSLNDGPRVPIADPAKCFYDKKNLEENFYSFPFTVITAIDLANPSMPQATCAAVPSGVVYVSSNAVYLSNAYYPQIWLDETLVKATVNEGVDIDEAPGYYVTKPVTKVHKFAFTKTGTEYRGSGAAKGEIAWGGGQPQFRMGEKDGAFGIFTVLYSNWWSQHDYRLTFLAEKDNQLVEVSHLPNSENPKPIGKPNEWLHATRFLGDRVYAVTFKKTDPLYVINIKDVANPKIEGALEIPGFSEYLHPVSDGYLLGIGKDAVDAEVGDEEPSFAWYQGLRMALFNVSDVNNPIEVGHVSLGQRGTDSAALYDHHAMTFLRGNATRSHRLTLPVSYADRKIPGYDYAKDGWIWYGWTHTGLYEFEISDGSNGQKAGIQQVGKIIAEVAPETSDPWGWAWGGWTYEDRAVLQGDAVHYVHLGKVWSAPWGVDLTPPK